MKVQYPAKIRYTKEDKSFLVEFPDLEGCVTAGSTIEEAQKNAKEALTGYLASIFDRGYVIPKPSKAKSGNIYMIEPDPEVATPIMLRRIRDEKKLNQTEVAKMLGISYQAYQRLENPGTCNPTIKTLEKVARIFEKQLTVEFV
ncbi:MAG TPA: type II toxin-antitoxin system HicB family antitoxin [Verrucomicrobiae bacterium]|nr:type II toxin-antitoxin system HicB family antitoxin [Verrucomicrobiae bacterium]